MGRVVRVLADGVIIAPAAAAAASPLKAGDGLVFDAAAWRSPQEPEEGGRIYHILPQANGHLKLEFGNAALNFSRIRPGDWVWRSHQPDLDKAVRPFTQPAGPVQRQPVAVAVIAAEGQPLRTEWTLVNQPWLRVAAASTEPLGRAQKQALSADFLREQLGRLGGTPYALAELTVELHGQPFAPSSLLNQLRRQAVEALAVEQSRPRPLTIHPPLEVLQSALAEIAPAPALTGIAAPQLHLLVRTPEQLEAALPLRPARSPWITWICTACARPSSRCRPPDGGPPSPAPAF
jgi:putative protease